MSEVSPYDISRQENDNYTGDKNGDDLADRDSDSSDNDAVLITRNEEAASDQDDDEDRIKVTRKRINQFSDSGGEASEIEQDSQNSHYLQPQSSAKTNSSDDDEGELKSVSPKSRIRILDYSDSDSDSHQSRSDLICKARGNENEDASAEGKKQTSRIQKPVSSSSGSSVPGSPVPFKYEEQKIRMKEKRNKMKQKFKTLVTSRVKEMEPIERKGDEKDSYGGRDIEKEKEISDNSDDDAASIERIKQIINERTIHLKSTIYDPDTSSDEERVAPKPVQKQQKRTKSMKPTSPKPLRMSAKQAMENMQKIKSESNRMLREKEVSLPYHRPKALSLRDIMSRRRPALTPDGKALPIKMNEEQLKQYALTLEERQKEMIELCKSDTEDENEEANPENNESLVDTKNKTDPAEITSLNDTLYDSVAAENSESILNALNKDPVDINTLNDTLYDTVAMENSESILKTSVDDMLSKDNVVEVHNHLTNNQTSDDVDMEINVPSIEETMKLNDKQADDGSSSIVKDIGCLDNSENTEAYNEVGTETDMHLVYNDSIEETDTVINDSNIIENSIDKIECFNSNKINTEVDSQLISLHYDTERSDNNTKNQNTESIQKDITDPEGLHMICQDQTNKNSYDDNDFSDEDIDMDDVDKMIEDAEIFGQEKAGNVDSPMLIRDPKRKSHPKLLGAPGMIIDLDGTDPTAHRKLTGVELLKERFTYFAKLKTPEEMERAREKRLNPGTQHLKLKQELENEIAEQRSLEWAKRLEKEKQLHQELNPNKEGSDVDDIDQIEAKLDQNDEGKESSVESEPEENDCEITDKPVKRNAMIADEAEESDDGAEGNNEVENDDQNDVENDENDVENDDEDDGDDEESDEESSESEEEPSKLKKSRILKAFEDSDDDTENQEIVETPVNVRDQVNEVNDETTKETGLLNTVLKDTQDDDLQLAQELKSQSEDLFASQSSITGNITSVSTVQSDDTDLGTQTFSIINSITKDFSLPDKFSIGDSQMQSYSQEGDLDAVVGMCSGSFSQSLAMTVPASQLPTSQIIGDDVLALCTGKFYDNPFISQLENEEINNASGTENNENLLGNVSPMRDEKVMEVNGETENISILNDINDPQDQNKSRDIDTTDLIDTHPISESIGNSINIGTEKETREDDILESILSELNEPEEKKPNKYFVGDSQNKENEPDEANTQFKKRLIIDSEDETENGEALEGMKKKSRRKRIEKRALQISDDESEQSEAEELEGEEYASDLEDDEERIVEYDSEENEMEIQPQKTKTLKKHKAPEFLEHEAELTSEDEWIGSGDEDEAGLDRMEREAGDDDHFNQSRLQRELGQIHIRDVLDQDKREVRIIQELLFEDGDLGAGSRQRKFRWKNTDGEEETGTVLDALPDTQEEEFESEEQWRKQRYERELFLRDMQKKDETEEILNISADRTSLIKGNLSKSVNSHQEVNTSVTITEGVEKKTSKDVPSPKKTAFTFFKQNYHGSLLTRGQGALARLAALATPLADDEDAPKATLAPTGKRNFVFATLTQEDSKPKVTKRKAETNTGTPRLVKKMRTEDKPRRSKSSLLDHMKV